MIDFTNMEDDEIRTIAADTKATHTEWDTMTMKTFMRECFKAHLYSCTPIQEIHWIYQVWATEQNIAETPWQYIAQSLIDAGFQVLAEYDESKEDVQTFIRGIFPKLKYRLTID